MMAVRKDFNPEVMLKETMRRTVCAMESSGERMRETNQILKQCEELLRHEVHFARTGQRFWEGSEASHHLGRIVH